MQQSDQRQEEGIRLNRYIASSGLCSRRQADEYIEQGRVTIDDLPALLGTCVFANQIVRVDNKPVFPKDDFIYMAYNKPAGIICTTDRRIKDNIVDAIGFSERIYPIGRLDKLSTGLILLTNDGAIVNRVLRATGGHEKEYVVTVNRPIDDAFCQNMAQGVPILNSVTLPCKIEKLAKNNFRIILTQGLNRQIRRMCEHFGYRVTALRRDRIMHICLGSLPEGEWRHLKPRERKLLFDAVTHPAEPS